MNIKADSGSPVAGWPEIKVRAMCQNKSRGLSGAIPARISPDHVQSPAFLRGPRADSHLPLADEHSHHDTGMSWCWEDSSNHCCVHGTVAASCPATPSPRCQTGLEAPQELRQFRQRAPQVQEALFLDDPSGRRTEIADLKAFVTSDEDDTVSGRYNDARLVQNQMRAFASNDTGEEPKDLVPPDTIL